MARAFKIGFIGTGGIALTHMKHLKTIDGVEIAAAADISDKQLHRAKDQYNIPLLFADYRAMLKSAPELDAVSVCTPNALHGENAIAALEAGKHVMVEKPMAMNAREAQKMVDAARASGKQLVVGFQERFSPNATVIRRQIEAGDLGRVAYVRAQALRRRGIPNWGVFGRRELQGGGPMIDIGVHILEAAHYMMGSPRPISATGNAWTYVGNKPCDVMCPWPNWDYKTYTVEDLAVGMIRFKNGAMLTIETSFAAHIQDDLWNVQIMGEKGGAVLNPPTIFTDRNGYMMNTSPASPASGMRSSARCATSSRSRATAGRIYRAAKPGWRCRRCWTEFTPAPSAGGKLLLSDETGDDASNIVRISSAITAGRE